MTTEKNNIKEATKYEQVFSSQTFDPNAQLSGAGVAWKDEEYTENGSSGLEGYSANPNKFSIMLNELSKSDSYPIFIENPKADYSDFDAGTLSGENSSRESWKIPAYKLLDLHAGYIFKLSENNKLDIKLSILNLTNEIYISDAKNNDGFSADYQDFDAKSASEFFGLGRRLNLSLRYSF